MTRAFTRYMLDVELGSNPKILRFNDKQLRCLLLGVWPLAAKADPRGSLTVAGSPATASDIAAQARVSVQTARSTLTLMRELRMLDLEGEIEWIHDWNEINPEPSPSNTPQARRDRVRRHRQRRRAEGEAGNALQPVTSALRNDTKLEREVEVEVEAAADAAFPAAAAAPAIEAMRSRHLDNAEELLRRCQAKRAANGLDPGITPAAVIEACTHWDEMRHAGRKVGPGLLAQTILSGGIEPPSTSVASSDCCDARQLSEWRTLVEEIEQRAPAIAQWLHRSHPHGSVNDGSLVLGIDPQFLRHVSLRFTEQARQAIGLPEIQWVGCSRRFSELQEQLGEVA